MQEGIFISPSIKLAGYQTLDWALVYLVASLSLGTRTIRGLCRVDPRNSAECESASGNGVPRVEHAGTEGRKRSGGLPCMGVARITSVPTEWMEQLQN